MPRAPETNEVEWRQYHRLLRTHPEQFLRIAEDTIRQYPGDPQGYLDCVTYWMDSEQYEYALADIDTALGLEDCQMSRLDRGMILRCLGRYREAIDELNRCEAMRPEVVRGIVEVNRAACHAELGDLEAALAECAKLPEDWFLPGLYGAPSGNKGHVTEAVRRIAAAARQK
jgi:tetratricopeptide (TPR) repeat protein